MVWTPTVLVFGPEGVERYRSEGYLPNREFLAQLALALARVAFMRKQWADAARGYADILDRFPDTAAAPEALYWSGVCAYKTSNDHHKLAETWAPFRRRYQDTIWAKKVSLALE